mgnify:CR=1 FL=1|jgi:GT2 family glycosyltransferase
MKRTQHVKKVIVQIVTHNNERTIRACIESVKAQTLSSVDVVVIDNASSDATRMIVKTLGVSCIALKNNRGYGAGHNVGLAQGNSTYVLTLNPDVIISPDFLQRLVSAMEDAGKQVGSAQPLLYRVEKMNEQSFIVDSGGLYFNPARRQKLRFMGRNIKLHPLVQQHIFGPDGAAAFYRRSMLRDIDLGNGIFDEDYFMHKEDVDICWRAQLRGWKSLFVPKAVGYHIRTFRPGRRENIHNNLRVFAVRNRYVLMLKNELPSLFMRDLVWIMAYEVLIFAYILLKEQASLSAYGQVVALLPSLLRKRAVIQRNRKVSARDMAIWFRWKSL